MRVAKITVKKPVVSVDSEIIIYTVREADNFSKNYKCFMLTIKQILGKGSMLTL